MHIQKLKFYQGLVDFSSNLNIDSRGNALSRKFSDTFFMFIVRTGVTKKFPDEHYGSPIISFFLEYPDWRLNPFDETLFYFTERRLKNYDNAQILYTTFHVVFQFGLFVPECLSSLKKYYPVLQLEYSALERLYLDAWIKVLPLFEDYLGHLLQNDTPLVEPQSIPLTRNIFLRPPIKEDVNFPLHLQKYYFGKDFSPSFSAVILDYLDNRPELKTKVFNEWKKELIYNKQISKNLAVYFICNYLIKNISKITLRFVVANTSIYKHGPVKQETFYIRSTMLEFDKATRKRARQHALKDLQRRQAEKNSIKNK